MRHFCQLPLSLRPRPVTQARIDYFFDCVTRSNRVHIVSDEERSRVFEQGHVQTAVRLQVKVELRGHQLVIH